MFNLHATESISRGFSLVEKQNNSAMLLIVIIGPKKKICNLTRRSLALTTESHIKHTQTHRVLFEICKKKLNRNNQAQRQSKWIGRTKEIVYKS
jgi:hypothetical protein